MGMMRARRHGRIYTPASPANKPAGKVCHGFRICPGGALIILFLTVFCAARPAAGQITLRLPGGIARPQLPNNRPGFNKLGGQPRYVPAGTAAGANYVFSFGTLNALAIGAPAANVTATALANGAIYFFTYQLTVGGLPAGHNAEVTGYVSGAWDHPAALVMENCPNTAVCTTAGSYSAFSTNAGAPSFVIPAPGVANNSTVTAGFGVFVP